MADPQFRSLKHTPPPAESASVGEALLVQAAEAARSVAEDLNQMARYGKIATPPSAVNIQGVKLQDEDWTFAVIVIAYPSAREQGAGDFIKAAFEGTAAEHRKVQGADPLITKGYPD